MKIEKVNDHQIRCTLTKADLIDRELKISELAYGTEKAKTLFRDMMQQASFECGFEAENIPLMIEAIPLNSECIILIITKVEDPEELDTRFSKFAPSVHDSEEEEDSTSTAFLEGADDVLDLFKKIHENKYQNASDGESVQSASLTPSLSDLTEDSDTVALSSVVDMTRVFTFPHLSELTRLAHVLRNFYNGVNSLYRNEKSDAYALILTKGNHSPEEFNKVCNIISEYGFTEKYSAGTEAYLNEHCELFIADNALQSLAMV
ncbi:adaptor protein MecA [Lachnospiraceae bacterium JLR.KK008]